MGAITHSFEDDAAFRRSTRTRWSVSSNKTKHAIAKNVLDRAEFQQSDEWGDRHAIRTDIVARPPRRSRHALPTPDPDDPTTRMAPDRVMALLKADDSFPEPLEATPGHSPTRVLDPNEVANAQVREPEPRRPFEVVESIPARPPRAPRVPSDFSTIPAEKTPAEVPAAVPHRESLQSRFTRVAGLILMAIVVFALTFGITKALRDDRAFARAKRALIENYDRAAARVDAWFGAGPASTESAASAPAPEPPKAAPPAALRPTPEPSEPAPPVVKLEDLKVLDSSSAEPRKPPSPASSKGARR